MKIIQTALLLFITLLCFNTQAPASNNPSISRADSLFHAKQYMQSFDIYQDILQKHHYTSSMLLKMAYIQEGLGHVGLCLYYLNLYYLATDDIQTLTKMNELASKYNLEGYGTDDSSNLLHFIKRNSSLIEAAIASTLFLMVAIAFFLHRRHTRPVVPLVMIILCSTALAYLVNTIDKSSFAIICANRTYMMNGPSPGANVVATLTEGHQLKILGHVDVWLKVEWMNNTAYVKENHVMPVQL